MTCYRRLGVVYVPMDAGLIDAHRLLLDPPLRRLPASRKLIAPQDW
ncbi:hypothetical protein [Nocardia colli]